MQLKSTRMVAMLGLFLFSMSIAWPIQAGEAGARVDASLKALDAWMGESDQAPIWHRYLRTDELRSELAKGAGADRQVVGQVLALYRSGADGLEDDYFVEVGEAVGAFHAQLPQSAKQDLPALARAMKDRFVAKRSADVSVARYKFRLAVKALGEYLDREEASREEWKEYLKWSDLQSEAAAKTPDLAKLKVVGRQLVADRAGLEAAEFLAVRDALRTYLDTMMASQGEKAKKPYQQQIGLLAGMLEDYDTKHTFRELHAIGQRLDLFDRMGQASELVQAIRREYSHPNLMGYVSDKILATGVDREIHQENKGLEENILGTQLEIDAQTDGEVHAQLVKDPSRAVFDLILTGITKTEAIGFNRGVTIYTTGKSELEGRKRFYITEQGLSADPATSNVSTESEINDISARRRFIERLAWRKAGKQQGQAEAIGEERAEARLNKQIDREANEMLSEAKNRFDEKFRDPLLRKDAFPQVMDFSSTNQAIHLTMLEATGKQLGAPVPAAPLEGGSDMAVQLHESVINNFASTLYAGRTLTSEEVAKENENSPLLKRFRERQEAKGQKAETEKEQGPWAITFARSHPITIEFQEGGARVTIRGTKFVGDGPEQERAMSIIANYKIELADNQGMKLTLKDWDVLPTSVETGGGQIKVGDEPLRQKLKARFGKIFKDLELDPLELPGQLEKAGKFAYTHADSKDGWLTLSWKQIPGTAKPAAEAPVKVVAESKEPPEFKETPEASTAKPAEADTAEANSDASSEDDSPRSRRFARIRRTSRR